MDGVFEDEIDCKRILREINLLKKLKHPFIIQIIDIIEPKNLDNFDTIYLDFKKFTMDLALKMT